MMKSFVNVTLLSFTLVLVCLSSNGLGVLEGNFLDADVPQDENANVRIVPKSVDVQGVKVHYLEAESDLSEVERQDKTLFLLHGAAFTSNTWTKLDRSSRQVDTIPTMARAGFNVIAVDLPGFGQTRRGGGRDNADFLASLIEAISPTDQVVLVSPSFSGSYSMPLLIKRPDLLCGFVPVAPGAASAYRGRLSKIEVPTLIVVGERDGKGSSRVLTELPNASALQIIPDAGHPAYLDDPDRWHKLLYNFMHRLQC